MKFFLTVFYFAAVLSIFMFYYFRNKKLCKADIATMENGSEYTKNHITPVLIFSMAFIAYSSIGMLDRTTDNTVDTATFFTFFLANFLGFICFLIGYGSDNTTVRKRKLTNPFRVKWTPNKKITIGGTVILAAFLFFVIINIDVVTRMITDFGSGSSYLDYSIREERTAFSGLIQALEGYFSVFVLLLPFYRCYTKKKIGLLDIIIVLVYFSWALFSGDRTTLIVILLMAVVFINERYKNINMKLIVIAVVAGLFMLILLGHLRRYNSIGEMLNMLLTEDLSSLLSLKGIGEFKNTTGTMLNYIKSNSGPLDFQYFGVYIRELLVWIPAFLFPNRPLPWAEQYMLDFYPNAPAGTGHGWFILTDGYMAFGLLGIVVEMLIYGRLVKWSYKKFFEDKKDAVIAFLYSYFLLFIFYSVRSSMMLTIKNYLISVFPVILIYFIFKKSFRNNAEVD